MSRDPMQVERVVRDEVTVLVHFDPEQIVDLLAVRLARHSDALRLLRMLDPKGDNATLREASRRKVIAAIGPALQVTLTAEEARRFGQDIDWAGRDAQPCRYATSGCDWLADETGECTDHQDARRDVG